MEYEKNPKYIEFVNKILDNVIMESEKIDDYKFFKINAQFTFITVNKEWVDFYPTTGKINFRDGKGWQDNGLKLLLDFILPLRYTVWLVQHKKTLLIHGCFRSKQSVDKFVNNNPNLAVSNIEVLP